MHTSVFLGVILSILLPNCVISQNVKKLPQLSVHTKRITLSGFSSGGTFAQMVQFSYSSQIHGVGVFSHTYYRCGPPTGIVDDYDKVCTTLFNLTEAELYNPEKVHQDIRNYHAKGLIDDPVNLRGKRLYVYSGLRNFLFTLTQSMRILQVYDRYINNPLRIRTRVQDAEIVLPTNGDLGMPCTERGDDKSFIGNCGFSGAFECLSFLHGSDYQMKEPLSPKQQGANRRQFLAGLKSFDQTEFVKGLKMHHMDTEGFYFVPSRCTGRQCLLHFYFHGCLTGREFVGRTHIENSGYLEVAEANDIIMVFPQAVKSMPQNDIGCWDTFGISGPLYATKQGPQIMAVKRMMDRVSQGQGSSSTHQGPTHSHQHRHSPLQSVRGWIKSGYGHRYRNRQ